MQRKENAVLLSKTEQLREAAALIRKWLGDLHAENAELNEEIQILLASQCPGSEIAQHHSRPQFNKLHRNQVMILELEMALAQIPVERPADVNTLQAYFERLKTDKEYRDKESWWAEVGRLAQAKCFEDLYSYHIFADGIGDFCVLNEHSMELAEAQKENEAENG